jgi:CelD/BcsL family acetyltransferase involved in cellulose biosynthesis
VTPLAGRGHSLTLQVITDEASLEDLATDWNQLLESSRSNSLFLTWEWIRTWWDVYAAGTLNVLTARTRDGELVGIAPFRRSRRRLAGVWPAEVIEFIGSGGDVTPEYLDIIAAPAFEQAVADRFAKYLTDERLGAGIDLKPFVATSSHLSCLESHLGTTPGGPALRRHESTCPIMTLPATSAEFMAGQSHNYRKKMGEYLRRGERDLSMRVRISTTEAELRQDMATLIQLHEQRWQGRSRAFRSTKYVEFHQRLALALRTRDAVRLFVLESESKPLAALYCFFYAQRYHYYQAGRDPGFDRYRLGLVILHKAIVRAIDEGAKAFDFLSGEEGYKFRWADHKRYNVRLTYWRQPVARTLATWRGF